MTLGLDATAPSGLATKIATGAAGLVLLVAVVAAGAGAGIASLLGGGDATPSAAATADIPAAMLALYQQAAATCPGLPWTVLAAIGTVESGNGQSTLPGVHSGANSAGAEGPMQFEPATFPAYHTPVPPGGVPPPIEGTVHQGTLPAPPLGQADHLAPGRQHLARADAGEAHEVGPRAGLGAAAVHLERPPGQGPEPRRPPLARLLGRPDDVVGPQRVAAGDPQVDPHGLARDHEHRPAATAPAHHREAGIGDDDRRRLRAPQDEDGALGTSCHGHPTAQGPEPLDVEPGLGQEAAAR